jgi:transposase InsO family protein
VLERLIEERGRSESLRSDNGPEFTSRRILGWAEDWKIGQVHIQPGRPMQNGHVESFHGRLRDECLNVSWFRTLNDVRCTLSGPVRRPGTEPFVLATLRLRQQWFNQLQLCIRQQLPTAHPTTAQIASCLCKQFIKSPAANKSHQLEA